MKTNHRRLGRLLSRYHSELKFKSFAEIKADPHLAHVVYDHYHQAMRLLNDDRVAEDRLMTKLAAPAKAKPAAEA